MEYDIALGVDGHVAKDTALTETAEPTEPMPYTNPEQFAVWCKTLLNPPPTDCKVVVAIVAVA